ncbi:DUF547 domain-containing protein [Maribacter algicola]|uniref:DUF547 domain-containing protein n=1 Tax=Meishania litoralis TaxID=3434685 RepID=A0ACC7LIY3_9FLAO
MRKSIFLVLFCFLALSYGHAQGTSDFFLSADTFLKTHVKDGRVDYKAIKDNSSQLNELLDMAEKIAPSSKNKEEYQAFWINGYNLLVIKGIVENYPLKSPLDVSGFFDKTKHTIAGETITLNDIENKRLRAVFPEEPRFHFVLVCGGLGCPPIIASAYKPETLDAQLETQTKSALNDPNFIQVNKNKVKISQIFEWYKGDFTQDGQSLVDFINKYRSEKLPEKVKVSYYPYDWSLNGSK